MERTTERETSRATFRDSEGLRMLLSRLQSDGGSGWRTDPNASELMQFAARALRGAGEETRTGSLGGGRGCVRRDAGAIDAAG